MNEMQLQTVDEIAEFLNVKASWVYAHADELGAYRLGKYLRFSRSKVLESVEKLVHQTNDPV